MLALHFLVQTHSLFKQQQYICESSLISFFSSFFLREMSTFRAGFCTLPSSIFSWPQQIEQNSILRPLIQFQVVGEPSLHKKSQWMGWLKIPFSNGFSSSKKAFSLSLISQGTFWKPVPLCVCFLLDELHHTHCGGGLQGPTHPSTHIFQTHSPMTFLVQNSSVSPITARWHTSKHSDNCLTFPRL